jgi:multidrug resistance efflux pump
MHPNPKRIIPVVVIIGLSILAWWLIRTPGKGVQAGDLTASGTIEATQVQISPEIAGKVIDVLVNEGDVVSQGQELARIEDQLLQAQLDQAEAALAVAQANADLVAAGVPEAQRQLAIAAAELELTQAQQALDNLNDTSGLSRAQADQIVAAADKALDLATQRLDSVQGDADPADIEAARVSVTLAKDRLDRAREDFKPYEKKPEDNVTRAMFQAKLAAAQKEYDAAVTRLNNLLGKANRYELALATANQGLAQAQLDEARRQYELVKNGSNPDKLALAEAHVKLAEASLAAALAEPTQEQLKVAQAQVQAAQAALVVIQAQVDKLVVYAPSDGTILSRSVEPGELIVPGAVLFTLARLDDLTVTVYIPEDSYGQINLNQEAQLTSDSFPGRIFKATVIDIADRAEFTPRNVQTAEGRRTTVFAIKLAVEDPEGNLKPGMPVDVSFRQ